MPIDGKKPNSSFISMPEFWQALPKIFLFTGVIIFLLIYRADIGKQLSRVTKLGFGPLSIEAVQEKLKVLNLKAIKNNERGDELLNADQVNYLTKRFNSLIIDPSLVNILWVDDVPVRNRQVVGVLEAVGFRVYVAQSLSQGQDLFNQRPFGVVISDYQEFSIPNSSITDKAVAGLVDVGPIMAKYVGQKCGTRTIIFSDLTGNEKETPPYVYRGTNNFYELLKAVADLADSPIDPKCG